MAWSCFGWQADSLRCTGRADLAGSALQLQVILLLNFRHFFILYAYYYFYSILYAHFLYSLLYTYLIPPLRAFDAQVINDGIYAPLRAAHQVPDDFLENGHESKAR